MYQLRVPRTLSLSALAMHQLIFNFKAKHYWNNPGNGKTWYYSATDRGRGGDVTLQVHVEVTWNSFYLPCRKLVANVVSQLPRTLFDQTWVCTLFFSFWFNCQIDVVWHCHFICLVIRGHSDLIVKLPNWYCATLSFHLLSCKGTSSFLPSPNLSLF